MSPQKRPLLTLLPLIAFLALALCRILGPSDLYDKEQPRTVAYTADMLLHHRWILPTDNFDIPATKPPRVNWLDAPFVAAFGFHEWTLKFPSLLAAAIILFCIHRAAKTMARPSPDIPAATDITATTLFALASLFWLATVMTARLMYVARPDMLVAACLTIAWVIGTEIITQPTASFAKRLLLWFAITASALAKGPIALLPIAYLLLAARLITGSWNPLKRAGLWWGIPLLLAAFGAWCLRAYFDHPTFFREILLHREVMQRLLPDAGNQKPFRWLITLPNGFLYILTRFLPWSLLPLAALIVGCSRFFSQKPRPPINFRHPHMPAVLWIAVIALAFCFLSTHRPDRYAPIFPPLALISAYLALEYSARIRWSFTRLAIVPFVAIAIICIYFNFFDEAAVKQLGNNVVAFAKTVSQKTGDATILFEDGEQTPLQTLLGRHQPLTPPNDYLQSAS